MLLNSYYSNIHRSDFKTKNQNFFFSLALTDKLVNNRKSFLYFLSVFISFYPAERLYRPTPRIVNDFVLLPRKQPAPPVPVPFSFSIIFLKNQYTLTRSAPHWVRVVFIFFQNLKQHRPSCSYTVRAILCGRYCSLYSIDN